MSLSTGLLLGLTFDLKSRYLAEGFSPEVAAEFDSEETVAALEAALKHRGFRTDRIGNVHDLVNRIAQGQRWDMVFNIAEGLWGYGREAQVPALLDAYRIPYTFSDALVLALTLHKGLTKHVIRDIGLRTPDFLVAEPGEMPQKVPLDYPLFVKPVAEGTGKGIDGASRVDNYDQLADACGVIWQRFDQAALIEEYLPGREFTVGIVGTGPEARVIGRVMEVAVSAKDRGDYSYANKANYHKAVKYFAADEITAPAAGELAVAAWRGLGCRDAGRVDLRMDGAGQLHFIEVNPLAGLHPIDSDLPILCRLAGITYDELIAQIIDSALLRLAVSGVEQHASNRSA